ncbi:SRPBCC family protein [Anaeromyxobacter paludicola]|uniref:Activator of Hsp90 ATPase homologue 1/2-like C-terminal domain-containing protein n=1 Tax=Anaeromyxobacter paludicola TaxID=2918171 RepID=A0ABN6N8W5_9BACT|nr:SRPBCC family protein [Anaeromyxobacter paludicola]BDG08703.1 hypothetical protein AMPC_18160 [Anaeromyxobacter paludicola]
MSSDRIEKRIFLRAPRARVWRALTVPEEFGRWFGARFDAGTVFQPAARIDAGITHPGYEHWRFQIVIERVEPETLFSYRWHPYPKPGADLSGEPMTLVELRLSEAPGGTELSVVESGFDQVLPARRDEAFRMNEGGWAAQLENIARHVAS